MQTAYPLPQTPATVSRWARMARVFATPHVVGAAALNSYGATISGLTVTIGRGSTGVAEAWVRNFFHVHDAADWSVTVPANTAAQARVDRIVLRWDPAIEDVTLEHVQGVPAASPVAKPLTQTDTGVWELPLWRFTVPANSGAPLTGLVDDRRWIDPATGGGATTTVYRTADYTRVTTTAALLVDDPQLVIPDLTPADYLVEASVPYYADGDARFDIGGTAAGASLGYLYYTWAALTAPTPVGNRAQSRGSAAQVPFSAATTVPTDRVAISGIIRVATAGSLAVRHGGQADTYSLTVGAGSWLRATRL